jgi:TolB-like protein/DNA-binding winged helix-turn-helix (wHTH) protein/Flp pilus assembly protein TadD
LPSPQGNDQKASKAPEACHGPARFFAFGPFLVDRPRRLLLKDGERLSIPPKALETLLVLLENRHRVVEKEELMARLWPDTVVEEANLTQNVFVARKALGDPAGESAFIVTIARRGYRFVADAIETDHEPPLPGTAAAREGTEPPPPDPSERRSRRTLMVALLLLPALVLGGWWLHRRGSARSPVRSLAVLPFVSLSADREHEYFADGITDAVITDLAALRTLQVISRQSSMRYKGSREAVPRIGRELGVDAVVEGTVLRSDGRLRLTVQLVDARTDRHLWAGSFERALEDVLALQADLARAVAREIEVTVSAQEEALWARARPVDPEAYDLYLRGRYFWGQRSREALRKSLYSFQRAIDRDPGFAPAHAGLAISYAPLTYWGYMPPATARPAMEAAARRALELDPNLVEAHIGQAVVKVFSWDWEGGEQAWRRIIARSPNHATSRLWYGLLLETRGRFEEALAQRRRAAELDPLSAFNDTATGDVLALLGLGEEAKARYRRSLELDPRFPYARRSLGWAFIAEGRTDEGIHELEQAVSASGGDPLFRAWLGHAYARCGRERSARDILASLQDEAGQRHLEPLWLAYVHAGLGDLARAFRDLERAYEQRSPALMRAPYDPPLRPLHADGRFKDLLARMRLRPSRSALPPLRAIELGNARSSTTPTR